jgi:hypothetical protein
LCRLSIYLLVTRRISSGLFFYNLPLLRDKTGEIGGACLA